jgi:hypothetical protein
LQELSHASEFAALAMARAQQLTQLHIVWARRTAELERALFAC